MKITYTLFAIAMTAVGFTTNANAQSSATASLTATLITPISIANAGDMNFGSLAASATAGTAELGSLTGVITPTGGVTVVAGGDPASAAHFTVTGEGTNAFSLSFPAELDLTNTVGTNALSLTITSDVGTIVNLVAGTKTINFGGILAVPENTVAGTYENESGFEVTVQYN